MIISLVTNGSFCIIENQEKLEKLLFCSEKYTLFQN